MAAVLRLSRATWARFLEPVAYTVLAAVLTLWVATRFYASLRLQTLHALHWTSPERFDQHLDGRLGDWSAPLDDVFIHFDFARAIARGFPFQWSEGNGYSSGGTSLLYPWLLAAGYRAGFRELSLMEWAAVIGCVCTFAVLLAARRLAGGLPRAASYLLPFAFLSVGALDWSLFSGMEVALFLALWAAAYLAYDDLVSAQALTRGQQRVLATWLGIAGGLVTATRPEGVVVVGVLVLALGLHRVRRDHSRERLLAEFRSVIPLMVLATLPSLLLLVGHSVANQIFTGERTAAGALVKLEAHHPFLESTEVAAAWWFHVKYQVLRVTQYHFADHPAYGWLVWALAAAALTSKSTRRPALVLWSSAIVWVLTVATNGQVRWQNERYTMPAVAWLLLAAGLGTAVLLLRAYELRRRMRGPVLALATLAAVSLFWLHQAPRFREQVWFFGRAARNIADQHINVGRHLRSKLDPPPQRVLVGDAGAITYVSDVPALDVIGLGGFRDLPFARATRQHIGAALELIERMKPSDRPDVMAIYPTWWGDFPLWFGTKIGEFPVRGNVICGGASKVLYRPNWRPLDEGALPFELEPDEYVVDGVDPADLLSEREHGYEVHGAPGFVAMKLLPSPKNARPLWDAGRIVPAGARESFRLSGFDPNRPVRLILRAMPTAPSAVTIHVDRKQAGSVRLEPTDGWSEMSLDDIRVPGDSVAIELGASSSERVVYQVFAVQRK